MFRTQYLDYAQLTSQLKTWADAHPGFVKLSSIGKSREGRELWMLTLGERPDEIRPAVWVDGNMHASEFCGSSVSLAIAEDVINIHLGKQDIGKLPAHMAAAVKSHLFYIVPRISPDGAEAVLKTGRYVRSHPADSRADKGRSYWQNGDVDGDGEAGYMRQQCEDGEAVELKDENGKVLAMACWCRACRKMKARSSAFSPKAISRISAAATFRRTTTWPIRRPTTTATFRTSGARSTSRWAPANSPAASRRRARSSNFAAHPNIYAWINYYLRRLLHQPSGDER